MSNYFEWDKSVYGLDVPEMDLEHEQLVTHMNKLHALHVEQVPHAQLAAALDTLVNYTARHFADEEAYMASIGHTGLKSHAGVHQELLRNVTGHVDKFRVTGKLSEEFFSFLAFWLKAHMRGVDARYSRKPAH